MCMAFWIAAVVGSAEDAWPPRRVKRPDARVRMAALIVALLGAPLLVGSSEAAPAGGMRRLAAVTLEGADRVAFVDLARGRVLRRLAVASGPHNLDATGNGRVVAVTSPPSGRVTILDGRRLRVLRVVSGFGSPHDVKLSPEGRTAYVVEEARGTLAVLDTGTGRVLRRVPVGVAAHDVAVGDLAWVTHGARDAPLTLLVCRVWLSSPV